MAPQSRYRLHNDPRTHATIARELLNGCWRSGSACSELESSLASLGAPQAVATARARVAIHLGVRALIRPGDVG